MGALNEQIDGNHYKDMNMQPIELGAKLKLNGAQQLIIKYVSRYKKKNGLIDLQKALHCCKLADEVGYIPFQKYPKSLFEKCFAFILNDRIFREETNNFKIIEEYVYGNNIPDMDLMLKIIFATYRGEYGKASVYIGELTGRYIKEYSNN